MMSISSKRNAKDQSGKNAATSTDKSKKRQRRGKHSTTDSNQWLDIVVKSRGLKEISDLHYKAEITLADLERVSPEEFQNSSKAYFSTPVEVFASDEVASPWLPNWVVRICPFFAIWPRPLELRLEEYDIRRYGTTDADVRNTLQKLIEIYASNLWQNIKIKRLIQFICTLIAGFITAASVFFFGHASNLFAGSGIVAAFAILIVLCDFAFTWFTDDQFTLYYEPALKNTADIVSRAISDRMRTLSVIVEQHARFVDSLLTQGEAHPESAERRDDEDYGRGQAFRWVQMMIWLPIRVLGLETCMRNKIESARKTYAKLDARGFAIAWVICVLAVLPALYFMFLYLSILLSALAEGRHYAPVATALIQAIMIAVYVVFAIRLTIRSYYNKDWAAGKDTLEEYRDTSSWATFSNSKFDIRIAARVQKAMEQIEFLNRPPRVR